MQGQDGALTDAWLGNILMDPQKGKQEVLTSNNEVTLQCPGWSHWTELFDEMLFP